MRVAEHGALHVNDGGHETPIVAAAEDGDFAEVRANFPTAGHADGLHQGGGAFHREAAGGVHLAKDEDVARGALREDGSDFDAFDAKLFFVAEVDFELEFVEGEALGGDVVEAGEVDGALRRDFGGTALTADAGAIVDGARGGRRAWCSP